jgi:TolB-like protein/DNA-binding winged helix-turn-helix (wHTH) protein
VGETAGATQVFRFEAFELDCRAHELKKAGTRVRLQEQPFQVLRCLLENAGKVVTRDELRQRVWPSSVYVDFDHGLNNSISALRICLGDDAGNPRFIETVPRLGYRFISPVEASPAIEHPATPTETVVVQKPHAPHRPGIFYATLAALGIAATLTVVWLFIGTARDADDANPPAASLIAVLPFTPSQEGDEAGDLGRGLSGAVREMLGRIHGLSVAGRESSMRIANGCASDTEIAATLGVDYLLRGSVSRSGSRILVEVGLVDARLGRRLWSRSYDRELSDIFEIQEEITRAITSRMRLQLAATDDRRLRDRGTNDAEAYRLYLVAREVWGTPRSRELYEAALARDPGFAAALAGIADYHFQDAYVFHLDDIEESVRLGQDATDRALALNPDSSEVLVAKANFESWRARFRGDYQASLRAHEDFARAIELDPANSYAYFSYARNVLWEEPELALQLYARLAELEPLWEVPLVRSVELSLIRQGRFEAARKRLTELATQVAEPESMNLSMAGLEIQSGNFAEAVVLLRRQLASDEFYVPGTSTRLWALLMSLGDLEGARNVLGIEGGPLANALREAAALNTEGRFDAALEALERLRLTFPVSRVLDVPTARQALIGGKPGRAVEILEARLPDLRHGTAPVTAFNAMPALDLATAYGGVGRATEGRKLLIRINGFLDGPDAPRLPIFVYLRARAHALAGERDSAIQELERAYAAGFRSLWAPDLHILPLFYIDPIDADPVFAPLRLDARFRTWRERIRIDNARQLERLESLSAEASAQGVHSNS